MAERLPPLSTMQHGPPQGNRVLYPEYKPTAVQPSPTLSRIFPPSAFPGSRAPVHQGRFPLSVAPCVHGIGLPWIIPGRSNLNGPVIRECYSSRLCTLVYIVHNSSGSQRLWVNKSPHFLQPHFRRDLRVRDPFVSRICL